MNWAILATGPSMSQAVADSVRGLCRVIAISDAYRLAPWAEVLVSSDTAWWKHHQPAFDGRRFSVQGNQGTEKLAGVPSGSNSGVLAIRVAAHLGAQRIALLGFDGRGSHFFGAHLAPLKNTTDARRIVHAKQLWEEAQACKRAGVEVFNCTPGSALACFPKAELAAVVC